MLRGIRFTSVVVAVGMVALLAGCAAPVPAHTHSADPKPTSSSTPTQAPTPSVRLSLGCADLVSDANSTALLGQVASYRVDQATVPKDMDSITERQYGSLQCEWSGPDTADGAHLPTLRLNVSPDAADGFNANIAAIEKQQQPTRTAFAGDQSEMSCVADAQSGSVYCSANVLVGEYWIGLGLIRSTTILATVEAGVRSLLVAVAGDLANAKTAAAWNPPGQELPAFCASENRKSSAAALNAAVGRTDLSYDAGEAVPVSASSYPKDTSDFTSCSWSTDGKGGAGGDFNLLTVSLLRGGAWAMPPILADAATEDSLGRGPYETVDVPGVGTAAYECAGETETCQVLVADGSLLIGLDIGYTSSGKLDSTIAKVLTAVAQSND
jgi:hypothetical protein